MSVRIRHRGPRAAPVLPGVVPSVPPFPRPSALAAGRVVRVRSVADHSELTVRLADGQDVRVEVSALPDAASGRHVCTGMRRMPNVELFLAGGAARAQVLATLGHGRELHRHISVGAALALAGSGAPTQVLVASDRCRAAS